MVRSLPGGFNHLFLYIYLDAIVPTPGRQLSNPEHCAVAPRAVSDLRIDLRASHYESPAWGP